MEEKNVLLIEQANIIPEITEDEGRLLKPIMEDFVDCYERNQDRPVREWLTEKLASELPEKTHEEVSAMANEIIESITIADEKKKSLENHVNDGGSKEGWFAKQIKQATSAMTTQETVKYLQTLDDVVKTANESFARTILTKAGEVSRNPNLDGYIAEMEHVQSFNMNAAANGSKYTAKVLEPNGAAYSKNGVDIEIFDETGKVVRRYQSKFCKDAEATQKAFEAGDYRGQQSLAPGDQAKEITRKVTDHLEAPDGTCSEPLSKVRAKELRDEAQSGKWNDKNWNDYKTADIAKGIAKQAGQAALLGAAIGAGTEVVEKLWKGEKVEGKEVVKKAVEGGADFGVKAALSGAIKAGAEKGLIRCIPKGTPAGTIAQSVYVGVENVKILYKCAKGEITGREALEKMEESSVSTLAGMAAAGKGAALGKVAGGAIGTLFGPAGTVIGGAIGGFVGGAVGFMAGSKVGQMVVKARRAVTKVAKSVIKSTVNAAKKAGNAIVNTTVKVLTSPFRAVASLLS